MNAFFLVLLVLVVLVLEAKTSDRGRKDVHGKLPRFQNRALGPWTAEAGAPPRSRIGLRQSSAAFARPDQIEKRQRTGAVQNLAVLWSVHGKGNTGAGQTQSAKYFPKNPSFASFSSVRLLAPPRLILRSWQIIPDTAGEFSFAREPLSGLKEGERHILWTNPPPSAKSATCATISRAS